MFCDLECFMCICLNMLWYTYAIQDECSFGEKVLVLLYMPNICAFMQFYLNMIMCKVKTATAKEIVFKTKSIFPNYLMVRIIRHTKIMYELKLI